MTPSEVMEGLGNALRRLLEDTAGLIAPRHCGGCERPDIALCADCLAEFSGPAGEVERPRYAPVPCFAAARFEGSTARVIRSAKDDGRHDAHAVLGLVLAGAVQSALEACWTPGTALPLLIPVPSTAAANRRRGAEFTTVLAGHAAGALADIGLDLPVCRALRSRRRRDQVGLGVRARRANLVGTLRPRVAARPRSGLQALLIDDVVTTGATLAEAMSALARVRITVIGAAVIAARLSTPRT